MAKDASRKPVRPKSRERSTAVVRTVKVVIHGYDDAPRHDSHMGGSFSDAGYRSGGGGFGFTQDLT